MEEYRAYFVGRDGHFKGFERRRYGGNRAGKLPR
jgi:hypothetical protein